MIPSIKKHGTTLTVGLFLVSTVSGVFLFFHVASSAFHAMHEWLSMVLIVPAAIHVWKNWPSFVNYFRTRAIVVPLALSLVAGAAFAYPALTAGPAGGNPLRTVAMAVQNGTVAQVAPLFGLTPEGLKGRLESKGYVVASTDRSLLAIAQASGKPAGPGLLADVASGQ